MDEVTLKRCSKCEKEFPATYEFFQHDKGGRGGLNARCRKCKNQINYAWAKANPAKVGKNYQPYSKTKGFPSRHTEYMKMLKRENAKQWRQKNPDKVRVQRSNRRSHEKAVLGSYTYEQIQSLLKCQKHRCYYCSKKFERLKGKYVYHVDHTFPLSRVAGSDIPANSIDYIVLACPTCNFSKYNKFPWEFPEGGRLL